eukprot:TRINITY_DN5421_c0_g1_i1.p1 TRINITY_DN5421_c0_g1~~TRINITY_DN5421_c0_g1_i1.p1  ORF type:complete len:308 (-),score=69.27 TRINITY_DN5421_c0_g1_i1:4-822(-)
MKRGGKYTVICKPAAAFGAHGNPHGFHGNGKPIPGNSTLTFEVQVLDIQDPSPLIESISDGTALAKSRKESGNELLKQQKALQAEFQYKTGLKIVRQIETTLADTLAKDSQCQTDLRNLRIALLSNVSLIQLKQGYYVSAKKNAQDGLALDKDNAKLLFRLGKAEIGLSNYSEAKTALTKALKIANLREIRQELLKVRELLKQENAAKKAFYSKAMQKAQEGEDGGLYSSDEIQERLEAARKAHLRKCTICDEEVEEIQWARHVIKKHGGKA